MGPPYGHSGQPKGSAGRVQSGAALSVSGGGGAGGVHGGGSMARERQHVGTQNADKGERISLPAAAQSVSWLYMKPPGYDDALARAEADKRVGTGTLFFSLFFSMFS